MASKINYPRMAQAIKLLFLFMGIEILFIIGIVILELTGILSKGTGEHPLTYILVSLFSTILVLRLFLKRNQLSVKVAFPLKLQDKSILIPLSIVVIGLSILLSAFDNLLQIYLPAPSWFEELFSAGGFWSFISFTIVAPLTEELLFRGAILRAFLNNYSVRKAIFMSSFLFAIIHLNPWQFTGAVILGSLFAWMYVKTGSLLPGIIGHAVNNALPTLLTFLGLEIQGYNTLNGFQPWWFNTLGLILTIVGVIAILRKKELIKNKPNEIEAN